MPRKILLIGIACFLMHMLSAQENDTTRQASASTGGYLKTDITSVTGAVVQIIQDDFNQGNINDPGLLIRNKVAGLGVYKKGSNPNQVPHLRIRGISSISRDNEPLIVVDGVIGATLENVDPNDIASFTILKSASATAIYGMRGASGVLLVTTKKGKNNQELSIEYRSFVAAASLINPLPSLGPSEFVAAGGNDIGMETDWFDEVSRTGFSHVHNLSASGGTKKSHYRVSFNARDVNGILNHSGFDQVNTRAYLSHLALNEKLKLDFNFGLTNRESELSFNEAFRYATIYNPTAPVRFENGNFWEAILFDNFNPVAILEQNVNESKTRLLNYGLNASYQITESLALNANYAQQQSNILGAEFSPSTAFFRGQNNRGQAIRSTADARLSQFESYLSFNPNLNNINLSVSAGYSFQSSFKERLFISMANLASNDQSFYGIDLSADQVLGFSFGSQISSEASPKEEIRGFFGQAQVTLDDAINLSLAVRRDGSTRLGANQKWGTFYGIGANIDVLDYMQSLPMSSFNIRLDYGLTGNLPFTYGLATEKFTYNFANGGTVFLDHMSNPNLQWEVSKQTNFGIDFGMLDDRFQVSADFYRIQNEELISRTFVDFENFSAGQIYSNNTGINTSGFDISIGATVLQNGTFSWQTNMILSGYTAILERYTQEQQLIGVVGAPGQGSAQFLRLIVGEKIGQFWSPIFESVDESGCPVFKDVNGDDVFTTDFGSALTDETDFDLVGNAIPSMEFGWSNLISYKKFDANLFFRGAVGHTLVNTFRLFYEPLDPGAINSYNRVVTEKAEDGLTTSNLSSLYYERADYLRLDNMTIGYAFNLNNIQAIEHLRLFGTVQNVFTLTNYTGTDPEAVLFDRGPIGNGGRYVYRNPEEQLAMGIDRRNFYYTARTFLIGIQARF